MAVLGRKGRDGGTFTSALCANAGVPVVHSDMLRRLLPASFLMAARMALAAARRGVCVTMKHPTQYVGTRPDAAGAVVLALGPGCIGYSTCLSL